MRRRNKSLAFFLTLLVLIFGLLAAPVSAAAEAAANKTKVIVIFNRQPGAAEQNLIRSLGGAVGHTFHIVRAIAATIPQAAINALQHNPNIVAVEADLKATLAADAFPWGITSIGADIVHAGGNTGTGSGGSVKVGIIDTGLDYNHPDLAGRYAGGYDFVNNDSDPMDDNSHGTHVAGTIAAIYNVAGVVGVAPSVSLYALKVLDSQGSGDFSDVIAALEWCSDHGIQVTNNSYGSVLDPGQALKDAFNYTYYPDPQNPGKVDILHIAAAGNQGESLFFNKAVIYPARYESVVAVSAIDSNNALASFSSAGSAVELAAPGVSVYSTVPGGQYATYSGTSMASPHVAGTAALVIAAGITDNKPASVRSRLQSTADDLGAAGRDYSFGFGRVDADEAAGATVPPTNDPPAVTIASPADGASYPAGTAVSFSGTATDPEDGSLTANLAWTSSLDGPIGSGGSFSVATLSAGTHAITASVTDSGGLAGSAAIALTITSAANTPPEIMVLSPTEGDVYPAGSTVVIGGFALDLEDGAISEQIVWTSNLNGYLFTGSAAELALSPGEQIITGTIIDSGGLTASASVHVTVEEPVIPTRVIVTAIDYRTEGGRTGTANLVITVTLQDDLGNAVAGVPVTVNVLRGSTTVLRGTATTGTTGQAVYKIKNAKAGTYRTIVTKIVSSLAWDGTYPANSYIKP